MTVCPVNPHHKHCDASKRISDAATQAWTDREWDAVGKWMAFNLNDGRCNGDVYDNRRDAIRHNDEFKHCFIKLHPGGMSVCEAEIMLSFHREAYENNHRLIDPDKVNGGRELIPSITREGIAAQIRALTKG